ncbi:MAG: hydantoinase B/oxoprolinase family protein [Proteobacteria bacterium]|nr:hydantoinase B/oxoprolinase family protein [Pseudomonadota bacterium]
MDVRCVRPFFHLGKLWCFLANSAHWADIGGAVPGGFSTSATEIQAEGLRITPIHILRKDAWEQETLDLILSNCRIPEERIGDLRSQVGALRVGEKRLAELLTRYGAETVSTAIDSLKERSEKQMRACIRQIPEGKYAFEAVLDSDGVIDEPLNVRLSMEVQEGTLWR